MIDGKERKYIYIRGYSQLIYIYQIFIVLINKIYIGERERKIV